MDFKDWVKKVRVKYGFTQQAMSEILNVQIGTLRSWEQGKASPPVYYQYLLSKYIVELMEEHSGLAAEKYYNFLQDI